MKKFLFLFFFVSLLAQGEVYLKISRQQGEKIDIGISPFGRYEEISDSGRLKLKSVEEVLVNDLYFSLYFVITHPPPILLKSNPDNFQFWRDLGSKILLKTEIFEKNNPPFITAHLYDLTFDKRIASKNFPLELRKRTLAHRISNWVVKTLTGEDGIFETKIIFGVGTDEGRQFFIMDYDGGNIRRLTKGGTEKLFPRWHPDGDKIVYSTYADKENMALHLIDLEKKEILPFLNTGSGIHIPGAWFPDGRNIAVSLSKEGNPEIYVFNFKDKSLKRLTNNPFIDISPYPSRSGREIVFVSDRTGSPQIYIMDREGINTRRLTYEGSYNTSPVWSPEGNLIAYTSLENGKNQIYIIDPLGQNPIKLTYKGNNEDPSWSPDGLHLVFRSNRDGQYDIYTMNWDGSEQKRLTKIGGCYSPSWGPLRKED